MGKLIKYEVKGSNKFILGVVLLIFLVTQGIYFAIPSNIESSLANEDTIFSSVMIIFLLGLVIFGSTIVSFFYIANLFKKELYEDSGYLTFTIPVTTRQIIGSKLTVAFLWNIVLGLAFLLANIIGIYMFIPKEILELIDIGRILSSSKALIALLIGTYSISVLVNMMTIYLSMTLDRMIFKNRRKSNIWYIIFLVIGFVSSIGQLYTTNKISMDIKVDSPLKGMAMSQVLDEGDDYSIEGEESLETISSGIYLDPMGNIVFNLGQVVYQFVFIVLAFFITSYIIEKKIEI